MRYISQKPTKMKDLVAFSEQLMKDFKAAKYDTDARLKKLFKSKEGNCMEYCPEPYLCYEIVGGKLKIAESPEKIAKPLYILQTNPGYPICFQHRTSEEVKRSASYEDYRKVASAFYMSCLKGAAAVRNAKSCIVAQQLGYDGIIFVETLPFHSDSLPGKNNPDKYLAAIKDHPLLKQYDGIVRQLLKDKPVLILSACNSKQSIDKTTISSSRWLQYQCCLAGVQINRLTICNMASKAGKVTSALFKDVKARKYIVLTMGGNNFPAYIGAYLP